MGDAMIIPLEAPLYHPKTEMERAHAAIFNQFLLPLGTATGTAKASVARPRPASSVPLVLPLAGVLVWQTKQAVWR